METDWVYRLCQLVKYPWVSRIDRKVYQEHPELDPIILARRSFFGGLGSYAVARWMGWNRVLTVSGCLSIFVAKFLID